MEIIPKHNLCLYDNSLGIVTPYRNQTAALQRTFKGTTVMADTVDKFQGRENKVIIISTVDNEISDFTDNPNRLNVAISRAIEQLILVINPSEICQDKNICDFVNYIKYNNLENLTHIDFVIYKTIDNSPLLAIKLTDINIIKTAQDKQNVMS